MTIVDKCQVTHYICAMIISFRHMGLEKFFGTGGKVGIQSVHAERLRLILGALDRATSADDVSALRGLRAHPLIG